MTYDFYKILDIPRDANLEDIKKAYRSKAKLVHPDVNNSPKANEVFAIVNEAYEVLCDERKRQLHDIKLNYVDAAKQQAARKKQYYGSSVKNDTYSNVANFHYDWNSFKSAAYKEKTDEDYFRKSPWLYNLFFISGMFLGFLIFIVCVVGTYRHLWPKPFGLIAVIGIILIKNGWNGILGKQNIYYKMIAFLRSTKQTLRKFTSK